MPDPTVDNPVLAPWTGPHGGAPAFGAVRVEAFRAGAGRGDGALPGRGGADRGQPRPRPPSPIRWKRWSGPAGTTPRDLT